MTGAAPLRVLVIVGPEPVPEWHRQVGAHLSAVADVRTVAPAVAAGAGVDVIVDLGPDLRTWPQVPRFGVWRYGFGDGAAAANGAAGTIARLYRMTADPSRATVLVEGWFRGVSDEAPGTVEIEQRVAHWCARVGRQIGLGDVDLLDGPAVEVASCAAATPPASSRSVQRRLGDEWRRWRRRERWTIGVVDSPLKEILQRGTMPEPRWVSGAGPDRYLADPFPVAREGAGLRVLAEEYRYRLGRGSLVALTIADDGRLVERREALAAPHHLAYPFLLRDGDSTVCIPDAASTGSIRAYRVGAPFEEIGTLVDGFSGVDPTIVHHEGRWWLFCTERGRENQTDLYVFFATDWRGPWEPHPLNPVKSDARSSRPAGSFFEVDGRLYRPAQDCSRRYGGAIAVNEIETLSPTQFRERVVVSLRPDPSWSWPDGVHTINAIGDVVVVDGLRVE